MAKIQKKSSFYRQKSTALVVLGIVIIYVVLALIFKFWPLHKHVTITPSSVKNSLPSNSANAKTGAKTGATTNSGGLSQTASSNPKAPAQAETNNETLIAPSGTFANLYNAHAGTQMNSICSTTPGATCQIIFTNGDVTVELPAKTADSGGAATWAWTPEQIGLTDGSWHVSAKATLGSQTKTTDNGSLELVIQ